MQLADFDYALPDELIARHPPAQRRDSRLLVVDAGGDTLEDRVFGDLPVYLRRGDLLVFNDTRVIPARLFGHKPTGGRVEVLIERVLTERSVLAQLRASKPPAVGSRIDFGGADSATVLARHEGFHELGFSAPVQAVLERIGEVPLPPYLGRTPRDADRDRYQTIYARHPGAVAAPTAGLHFDDRMLAETSTLGVAHAFVTLHVGAGTFKPLRCDTVADNRLHAEHAEVDDSVCKAVAAARAGGGRVTAIGTTSVRSLEAASANGKLQPFQGETDLFVTPGYEFRSVDMLLTNFHLPRSSLLILVAAFAGADLVIRAYEHAVAERYRFFSYGDAMLVIPSRASAT